MRSIRNEKRGRRPKSNNTIFGEREDTTRLRCRRVRLWRLKRAVRPYSGGSFPESIPDVIRQREMEYCGPRAWPGEEAHASLPLSPFNPVLVAACPGRRLRRPRRRAHAPSGAASPASWRAMNDEPVSDMCPETTNAGAIRVQWIYSGKTIQNACYASKTHTCLMESRVVFGSLCSSPFDQSFFLLPPVLVAREIQKLSRSVPA